MRFQNILETRDDLEDLHNLKHHNIKPGKLPVQPRTFELNILSAAHPSTIDTKPLLHI